ncbi:hypothetical protein [Rubritalea tangerina]|uniref:hypothetical protein n=1 Tax=Rubritalea tangerina TaxID=430798 RepID=UPI00360B8627
MTSLHIKATSYLRRHFCKKYADWDWLRLCMMCERCSQRGMRIEWQCLQSNCVLAPVNWTQKSRLKYKAAYL